VELGNPYTAALSNAVSITLGDVHDLLAGTPIGALPTTNARLRLFLHEGAHHTSLASSYGWAVAALSSSVISPGVVGPLPRTADELFLPARDLLVLRWTRCLFGPLLEGLALFAEHDIAWGESDLVSQPLLNAVALYFWRNAVSTGVDALKLYGSLDEAARTRVVADARRAFDASINEKMRQARSSPYWLAEKEALLRSPLLGSDGGPPYLLGYLAAKRAFLKTRHEEAPRSDPDGFLLLMLHYWFSDRTLARTMLDVQDLHPMQVQQTLGLIAERFQDRWDELYRSPRTAAASVEAYLADRGDAGAEPPVDLQVLVHMRTLAFSLTAGTPRFFKHRLVLRHGAQPVALRVDDDGRTVIVHTTDGGAALFSAPLVPNSDVTASIGTVELVRSGNGRFDALVVLGGDGLLAAWDLRRRTWNPPDLVGSLDDLPSGEDARRAELAVQRSHWEETWRRPNLVDLYEHQLAQATEVRDVVHLQIAFPGARSGDRERIVNALRNRGFAGLFDEPGKMRRIARYSLLFGGRGAPVVEAAAAIGEASEALSAEIHSINARSRSALGVDLFESAGGWMTSSI
jgi:hypothetical protein